MYGISEGVIIMRVAFPSHKIPTFLQGIEAELDMLDRYAIGMFETEEWISLKLDQFHANSRHRTALPRNQKHRPANAEEA